MMNFSFVNNIPKSISVLIFLLLEIVLSESLLVNDPSYCYTTDSKREQIRCFGTETPYDKVRGSVLDAIVSKCKPARFWYIGRHGSRFPSETENLLSSVDNINKQVVNNYPSKTSLCFSDVEQLDKWKINVNFTIPTSGLLAKTGWNEMKEISQRLQKKFPNLLPKIYSSSHYYFRRTPVKRTLQSAQAFASGLFGNANFDNIFYDGGSIPDPYLLPFAACQTWMIVGFAPIPEQQAFLQTNEYQQMVKEVSKKLGFHGSYQLSADKVGKLMTHCKYEQIQELEKPSAFCAAFSPANHQVSEYFFDLFNYYRSGYGFTEYRGVFENMGCTMVQAMLRFLQSNNSTDQIAKIWIGHDVSLQLVFVSLGLYEDAVPLRANNFAQQAFRQWRASLLTPMAGNMAVVRYDCADGDNEVLFLHNELPMQIPGCLPNGVCKLSLILEKYRRFLNANCESVSCSNIRL